MTLPSTMKKNPKRMNMTNVNKTVDVAALDLLCDKLECGDANHRATAAQIRKAMNGAKPQLPDGIEWPRFEDGELVKFGDEFIAPEYGENEPQKLTRLALYTEEHFHNGAKGAFWEANYFIPGGAIGKDYRLKRPEPEVLDADGVPIKVGDTVWYKGRGVCMVLCITRYDGEAFLDLSVNGANWNVGGVKPSEVTHRKPDTQEDINTEAVRIANLVETDCFTEVLDGINALLERQRKLMGGE